jgi:hypothetical protein
MERCVSKSDPVFPGKATAFFHRRSEPTWRNAAGSTHPTYAAVNNHFDSCAILDILNHAHALPMTRLAALGLIALVLPELASALWPFKQKRFSAEALIDAGPVGLEDIAGRVAAVGDWNGDQKCVAARRVKPESWKWEWKADKTSSDLFVLSQDGKSVQVHLWDRGECHVAKMQVG